MDALTVDVSPVCDVLCSVNPAPKEYFIGNILNWMLMGTLVLQLYTYYQTFPTDKFFLRLLVNGTFLLDMVQTVISTHYGWFLVVTTWGNPAGFNIIPWSGSMIPVLCGVVSAVVQIFYAWRIWVLAPNRLFFHAVSILIVLIALIQGVAAIVSGAMAIHTPTPAELIRIHPEFSLTEAKQNAIWSPTETILTKLIHRVIQTGAATAIGAAICLALDVGFPSMNFHYVPAYILGKVYTNSLMLSLNLRRPTAPWPGSKEQTPQSGLSFRIDDSSGHSASSGNNIHISRTGDMECSHPESGTQKDNWEANTPPEHMVNIPNGRSDTTILAEKGGEIV
ncbi:hypothetical protein B0H19DRAFT_1332337 [Mycena capillaripes]|nr:hypothetical protein B0H19DRAFT_1332337 [Mycena capillaripes]